MKKLKITSNLAFAISLALMVAAMITVFAIAKVWDITTLLIAVGVGVVTLIGTSSLLKPNQDETRQVSKLEILSQTQSVVQVLRANTEKIESPEVVTKVEALLQYVQNLIEFLTESDKVSISMLRLFHMKVQFASELIASYVTLKTTQSGRFPEAIEKIEKGEAIQSAAQAIADSLKGLNTEEAANITATLAIMGE